MMEPEVKNEWLEDGKFLIRRRNGDCYFVTVDPDLVDQASEYVWRIATGRGKVYVVSGSADCLVQLHRYCVRAALDEFVVFLDGDTLNCRRSNLKAVEDRSAVIRNGKRKAEKQSSHRYITWSKSNEKWMLRPYLGKEQIYLGMHESEGEAWKAYLEWKKAV